MTDPIRLLSAPSSGGEDLGRELLSSARTDQASADAEERAMAMLGLTAATLAAASSAAAGTGASTASLTTATTGASFAPTGIAAAQSALQVGGGTALKLTSLAFVKWVGIGVIAVAAAAGTYEVVTTPSAPVAVRTQTPIAIEATNEAKKAQAQSPNAAAAPTKPESVDTSDEQPSASTKEATTPDPSPAGVARPSQPLAQPAPAATSLAGELTLLDKARAAIAQHDATTASSALDEYGRRYPNGTMKEEATVARIETLLLAGQSAQASQQAEQFLREHPSSTNTKRVRQLYKRATQDQ